MRKAALKSILLILLISGSIYQVIMLWFDPVSDRNFFYTFLESARANLAVSQGISKVNYMIEPQFAGVYLGASDRDYTLLYPDTKVIEYDKIYEMGIGIVSRAAAGGKATEVGSDMQVMWSGPNLFFEYAFALNRDVLKSTLGLDLSRFEELDRVDAIGIVPAGDLERMVKVYIVGGDRICVFELTKNAVASENQALLEALEKIGSNTEAGYVSTKKNDIDFFSRNTLIPLPGEALVYERTLKMNPAFVEGGVFQTEQVSAYIDNFFENPAVKWTIENSDNLQYGDDKTLIEYTLDGVLRYKSVKVSEKDRASFDQDLVTAQNFIKKDAHLEAGHYELSGYTDEDGVRTFYYSYLYGDIPLNFKGEYLNKLGLEAPMTVRVSKGQVVDYKRLILDGNVRMMGTSVLKSRFETTLDKFLDMEPVVAGELQDMYLAYDVSPDGSTEAGWIIEYQNQKISLPLE